MQIFAKFFAIDNKNLHSENLYYGVNSLKPVINVAMRNITAMIVVSFVNPDSAFFCEANKCDAPPIPRIPSPFGECSKTSNINNRAETICIIQKNFIAVILFPFCYSY